MLFPTRAFDRTNYDNRAIRAQSVLTVRGPIDTDGLTGSQRFTPATKRAVHRRGLTFFEPAKRCELC